MKLLKKRMIKVEKMDMNQQLQIMNMKDTKELNIMTTEIKLVLDRKFPSLNMFLHESKKEQAMMKREFTAYVSRELNKQGCVPDEIYSHIRIGAIFYEVEEGRDPDNVLLAFKFINDALICSGLVGNDGIAQISFGGFDFKPHCKNYKIELSLKCSEFKE